MAKEIAASTMKLKLDGIKKAYIRDTVVTELPKA